MRKKQCSQTRIYSAIYIHYDEMVIIRYDAEVENSKQLLLSLVLTNGLIYVIVTSDLSVLKMMLPIKILFLI